MHTNTHTRTHLQKHTHLHTDMYTLIVHLRSIIRTPLPGHLTYWKSDLYKAVWFRWIARHSERLECDGASDAPRVLRRGGGARGGPGGMLKHMSDPLRSLCADSKGLSNPGEVEALREKVYASLEAYCKHKYPDQPGR